METTLIYWGYMERMENGNYYESAAFQRLLLGGFSRLGVPFWGPHNKGYSILGVSVEVTLSLVVAFTWLKPAEAEDSIHSR